MGDQKAARLKLANQWPRPGLLRKTTGNGVSNYSIQEKKVVNLFKTTAVWCEINDFFSFAIMGRFFSQQCHYKSLWKPRINAAGNEKKVKRQCKYLTELLLCNF